MILRRAAIGLAALSLSASAAYAQPATAPPQYTPTIVHLRWMHYVDGMDLAAERTAKRSNTKLAASYDSLTKILGAGPLYIDGFGSDEDIDQVRVSHALTHRFEPKIAEFEDQLLAIDGPLFKQTIEGTLPVRPAFQPTSMAEYFAATDTSRSASVISARMESLEDDLIARLNRDSVRVAYVLLGCTHNLRDAITRNQRSYNLITISTPEVRRENKCEPNLHSPKHNLPR